MVGWHHEFEQALGVGNGQGSLACCSPWGLKESDMTEWMNWSFYKIYRLMKLRKYSENQEKSLLEDFIIFQLYSIGDNYFYLYYLYHLSVNKVLSNNSLPLHESVKIYIPFEIVWWGIFYHRFSRII